MQYMENSQFAYRVVLVVKNKNKNKRKKQKK